jgi:hypothetical protein
MGVQSLVFNKTLSTKRLGVAVEKSPAPAPAFVYGDDSDDILPNAVDIVSPYRSHESSILDESLKQTFVDYLQNLPEQGEFGITYAQIFEQLTLTSPSETRHALAETLATKIPASTDSAARTARRISRQRSSKLVQDLQDLFREFIGAVGPGSHPEWAS